MTPQEQVAQLIGVGMAAMIGGWVAADARRLGLKYPVALAWGAGVMCALIFVLPFYLYFRHKNFANGKITVQETTAPCPYCGYLNKAGANYCEKCNRQLKSSNDIHAK